ncbi:hypothetical protein DPMN_036648 [Dreissena polymorpha]|uniref:Uncharacterized protein n=1 Tax=Dreissena polymorpha TaxID=45954 RepID=A0A9D4MB38_DREPO|nr:hypothetical protein DPMN_036648 [Dreissena polymorpha]
MGPRIFNASLTTTYQIDSIEQTLHNGLQYVGGCREQVVQDGLHVGDVGLQ